ncbi:MAG TPA: ATP synthase F1 subunit delta [Polyangiaceae bacterium]|nr:ATP synthase F1 subunit delta [Polyangiaceae bacterium]
MSVSIVARRYAQAMLELGIESGQLDKLVEEVATLADAWDTSAELRNVVENPLVPHAAKKAVVRDLAEQIGASATTTHTLLLLVDRRRAKALPYLARALRMLADARKGLVRAEVTTVTPLPEPYYGRLQAQLEKMTGMRVVVDRKLDPSLIGGVVARIGDRVFDASLRTRLESLRDAMMPTTTG